MADSAPPKGYVAETSLDGKTWKRTAAGEFGNIAYALATQRIAFTKPVESRYLRLTFAETALPAGNLAVAGIGGFVAR
jgi:alpha-L-fucosidase